MASRTRRPALKMIREDGDAGSDLGRIHCTGITSRPMPSPGIRPMRNDLEAILDQQTVTRTVNAGWVFLSEDSWGTAESKSSRCQPTLPTNNETVFESLL